MARALSLRRFALLELGVSLEPPQNPDRVSSFLNIRVADIQTVYQTWSERGAKFLTPPINRGPESRCYLRDRDGHLIEIGRSNRTDRSRDWCGFANDLGASPQVPSRPSRTSGPQRP